MKIHAASRTRESAASASARADEAPRGTALPAAPHVQAFYEARPFPGYAPADDAASILDRCRRSPFLVALDRAVPPDARVLDAGCGTAQLANFLALAGPRRRIVGAD